MFSVVIPTYNRAPVIGNAIQSIIDQEYKDWELIVIDDGSTDDTEQKIKQFENKKIRYFKIPHQNSIGKVRNYGNKKAKGGIIVVQDSDDISYPHRLGVIAEHFKKHPETDLFYHSILIRKFLPSLRVIIQKIKRAEPFDKDKILRSQYVAGVFACKRDKALKIPYREELQIIDEHLFLIDWAMKGMKFGYTDEILYEYFITTGSTSYRPELFEQKVEDMKTTKRLVKEDYGINLNVTLKQEDKTVYL